MRQGALVLSAIIAFLALMAGCGKKEENSKPYIKVERAEKAPIKKNVEKTPKRNNPHMGYGGIGICFNGLTGKIYKVFKGSPAERAGLAEEDEIVMVNDFNMAEAQEFLLDQASRGVKHLIDPISAQVDKSKKEGKTVRLKIRRKIVPITAPSLDVIEDNKLIRPCSEASFIKGRFFSSLIFIFML